MHVLLRVPVLPMSKMLEKCFLGLGKYISLQVDFLLNCRICDQISELFAFQFLFRLRLSLLYRALCNAVLLLIIFFSFIALKWYKYQHVMFVDKGSLVHFGHS